MSQVLHFPSNQEVFHAAMSQIQTKLDAISWKKKIELNVANGLWAQKNYGFRDEFLELARINYGSIVKFTDFITAHEAARKEINRWVERKTKRKIKNALAPEVLRPVTRLVIVNGIYFKGDWMSRFKKKHTETKPFWISRDKSVKTSLMQQENEFHYAENQDLKILELPYVRYDICMIVILPKAVDGLCELEESLTLEELNTWLEDLRIFKVNVTLPKFKMTSRFSLVATLSSMGMSDVFDEGRADFSGMTPLRPLFIDAVEHSAVVEVDEQGTVAAAATGVSGGCGAEVEPPSATFLADHPFVFLIRENHTGTILFLGRVVDPRDN